MNYTVREKSEFQQDSVGPEKRHKGELDKQLWINSLSIFSCSLFLPSDNKSSSHLFTHSHVLRAKYLVQISQGEICSIGK